jgi:uncharacterized protein (DUF1015 family)
MQSFKQFSQMNTFSGFLISRVAMPQINDMSGFINFLDRQGVDVVQTMSSVETFNPTQTHYDEDKVNSIIKQWSDPVAIADSSPIIVSDDGFVLDGHHRFLAAKHMEVDIPIVLVSLPINQLMKIAFEYTELRSG